MKKIVAYECEYCKKILKTKSYMYIHEKSNCFKNPISKSCITCENLALTNSINGTPISEHEELILSFKIEETYETHINYDDDGPDTYKTLNKEFEYLNDCNIENYCNARKIILKKLTTKCNYHSVIN